MSGYAGTGQATLLRESQQKFLWQNEAVAVDTLSVAYELARINRSFYPWGLSFEATFSSAPGAFEIDIMGANNDIAANFISLGTIVAVNSTFVGRWDMPPGLWPRYVAGFMKTLTNAAALVTVQVTR
jgi:hypothetical protein